MRNYAESETNLEDIYVESDRELQKGIEVDYTKTSIFPVLEERVPFVQLIQPSNLLDMENTYRIHGINTICGVDEGELNDLQLEIYDTLLNHFTADTFEYLRNKHNYKFTSLIKIVDVVVLNNMLTELKSHLV